MASVRVKFRSSTVLGEPGSIYYQVIHNRVARQKITGYKIYPNEWNPELSEVELSMANDQRREYLNGIIHDIQEDLRRLQQIIESYEERKKKYSSDDIIMSFSGNHPQHYIFGFIEEVIDCQKVLGRIRTSETYRATLNSFKRFRKNRNVPLSGMNAELMMAYEAFLREEGLTPNSSSFYLRNLRAVYNRAVEKGLVEQSYPFRYVYTGVGKTVKRGIPIKTIRQIKEMDLSGKPKLEYARDMFLFSFYTRGMSFVDMAFLKKRDLKNGVLMYRRRKTGQQLNIRWEDSMQKLLDKYDTSQSPYLLPIIRPTDKDERKQYIYAGHNINRALKLIGNKLGLCIPLTMYVARHAWASIAKSKKIPLSVISEGMGHDSENTTRIYLATLDTNEIDKANRLILRSL